MLPAPVIRIAPHVTLKLLPVPCQVTPLSAGARLATLTEDLDDGSNSPSGRSFEVTPSDPIPIPIPIASQFERVDPFLLDSQPSSVLTRALRVRDVDGDTDINGIAANPAAPPKSATSHLSSAPTSSPYSASFPCVQGPFQLQRCLQSGTFGDAWAATDESSGRLLCLKVFRSLDDDGLRNSIRRELRVYRRIATSKEGNRGKLFIMELERSIQHNNIVSFAMELMATDLATYMYTESERCKLNARRMMAQLALGLASLHDMGILHRDIKSENVLVDCRENVRIADFGLAHVEQKALHRWGEYATEFLGTPQCMAPEVLRNKGVATHRQKRYGMAVDWWALGCLLFELESSEHEQLFGTAEEVYAYVAWTKRPCRLTLRYPKFEGLDSIVVSLLEGLLRVSPGLRYSLRELEKHQYFLRRNGTSEFVNTASRAMERHVMPHLVPQLTEEDEDCLRIPRAKLRSMFDWVNPKWVTNIDTY